MVRSRRRSWRRELRFPPSSNYSFEQGGRVHLDERNEPHREDVFRISRVRTKIDTNGTGGSRRDPNDGDRDPRRGRMAD
jgi:hypothetical protein